MHLYLDTADQNAAEALLGTGLFTGLTTNPTILQQASRGLADLPDIYTWATACGVHEVFFQAWGEDPETLVECSRNLSAIGDEVVVKLVASRAGMAACAQLVAEGIPTLLTAVYNPGQAIIAAAAGATYIAPYLRRLTAAGRDGFADVLAMHQVLTGTGSTTKMLLASIPDVAAMVTLARQGVDRFTIPPPLAEQFFAEELTAEAAETFEKAVREASA